MDAVIYPNPDYSDSEGHLDAKVKYISEYPADEKNISLIQLSDIISLTLF